MFILMIIVFSVLFNRMNGGGYIAAVPSEEVDGGYNPVDPETGEPTDEVIVPGEATEAKAEAEITLENYDAAKALILKVGATQAMAFGASVAMDASLIIRNNRTMLPIRVVAESLGATVGWNAAERKATITKGSDVIEITIDFEIAKVNGKDVKLDAPAFIENSRTYLPLRFVAENLKATVLWDAKERQAIIVPNAVSETSEATEGNKA